MKEKLRNCCIMYIFVRFSVFPFPISLSVFFSVVKILYFKEFKKGSYVDVGCNLPKTSSLTYLLYKKGWSGINIDLDGKSEWICSKTGDKYFLANQNLIRKKSQYWD